MNFECHITISSSPEGMQEAQKSFEHFGWSFSCIAGDPLLGKDTFCYATQHFTDIEQALTETKSVAVALHMAGFKVFRRKVEQIMSDERLINGHWVRTAQ